MYMPSIFGESLFDDMFPFDDSFFTSKKNPLYGKNASRVMKTDIKENEGSYELDIFLFLSHSSCIIMIIHALVFCSSTM